LKYDAFTKPARSEPMRYVRHNDRDGKSDMAHML
jgi:hypothetical protein